MGSTCCKQGGCCCCCCKSTATTAELPTHRVPYFLVTDQVRYILRKIPKNEIDLPKTETRNTPKLEYQSRSVYFHQRPRYISGQSRCQNQNGLRNHALRLWTLLYRCVPRQLQKRYGVHDRAQRIVLQRRVEPGWTERVRRVQGRDFELDVQGQMEKWQKSIIGAVDLPRRYLLHRQLREQSQARDGQVQLRQELLLQGFFREGHRSGVEMRPEGWGLRIPGTFLGQRFARSCEGGVPGR